MLIDPLSGMRMKRARAAGGVFWYCKHSGSRLLTVTCSKKFFGEDGTREIWMRSGINARESVYKCPSCTKPMNVVSEPGWLGGGEVDVCRRCHLIWVKPEDHPEVPAPEDLLTPDGDSTMAKHTAEAMAEYLRVKDEQERDRKEMVGEGPGLLRRKVFAFLMLPVEMSEHGIPLNPLVSWVVMAIMALVFFTFTGPGVYEMFGFYPDNPLKNGGLNVITSSFFHGGLFHFLFNLYFFNMFSDDVEFDLGSVKYIGFLLFSFVLVGFFNFLFAREFSRDIPNVGMSGTIMALMTYYSLQFPKARLAYLFPALHTIPFPRGGYAWVRGLRWVRVPAWSVLVFYFVKDLLYYKYSNGSSGVSHSGHISGVITGAVLWFFMSRRPDPQHDSDITGEIDLTPGHFLKSKAGAKKQ